MFFGLATLILFTPDSNVSHPIEREDIEYSNTEYKNDFRQEFYSSNLVLQNVVFENNTCMGTGIYPSYGGALFLKWSSLYATSTTGHKTIFNQNKAAFGGAICCIDCPILLQDIRLSNNIAYKLGGAIYAEAQQSINFPKMNSFYLTNCQIFDNHAHSSGGVLDLHDLSDVYIQNTNLYNNRAGFRGGAISCNNIKNFHLNGGQIFSNFVKRDSVPFFNGKNDAEKVKFSTKWLQAKEVVKHGGAIYAYSKVDSVFRLEDCCFFNNDALFYRNYGKLNDVMIDSDKMTQCIFLNINEIRFESSGKISKYVDGKNNACAGNTLQLDSPEFSKAPNGIVTEFKTAFIPAPTTFTYRATPITKFMTAKIPHSITTFSINKVYIVTPSPHSTPHNTPEMTARATPIRTISPSKTPGPFETITSTITRSSTLSLNSTVINGTITYYYTTTFFSTYIEVIIILPPPTLAKYHQGISAAQLIVNFIFVCVAIWSIAMIGLFLCRKLREPEYDSDAPSPSSSSNIGTIVEKRNYGPEKCNIVVDEIEDVHVSDANSEDDAFIHKEVF